MLVLPYVVLLSISPDNLFFFFFFNDPPPTGFSPLPLPDALPICADIGETSYMLAADIPAGAPQMDPQSGELWNIRVQHPSLCLIVWIADRDPRTRRASARSSAKVDRKSTRLTPVTVKSRMPSSA